MWWFKKKEKEVVSASVVINMAEELAPLGDRERTRQLIQQKNAIGLLIIESHLAVKQQNKVRD